jgi:endonuclease/exonuclease/phosphatase family metal-dependent hydrolase
VAIDEPDVLRVLTWNVRDMLGDPLAVHRVLRQARADVVCLQEAPRLIFTRHQLAYLARKSGMTYLIGGRASAGTALLASLRADVRNVRAVRLPVDGWLTRPRGWAHAQVALPGTARVLVASIHLGLSTGERRSHVARIVAVMQATALPAVIGGDLNEHPGGPSWQALSRVAVDPAPDSGPTFPARRPRSHIDAVLASPRLEVVEYGPPGEVDRADVLLASDHLPVLARLRLPAL